MAVESIGSIYSVNIPGLTDAADIQAAFQAYHYGAYTSIATTAGIGAGGLAYWLKAIDDDIALLEARPSSGGDATSSVPVAGDFNPSGVPDGYIWVDFDGSMTSSVIGATAIYNNNAPTSNITSGIIWVDKDASTSTTGNPFIPAAVIAAKGDLLAGVSNDTVTVLTVGSNGQYLKADSSTTSGLTWAAAGDVTLTGTQTLTNKTLTSPVLGGTTTTASGNLAVQPATYILEVQGGGSTDASIQLNCYVNSHGQKIKSQPHSASATNTLLLPGGNTIGNSDSVLVSEIGTQTLTNKTLVAPTIQGASVTGGTFVAPTLQNPSSTSGTFVAPILQNPSTTGGTFLGASITSSTTFGGTSNTQTIVYPILNSPEERMNISASTSTGTINVDLATAGIWYYTNNSAANHTVNFRFSSSTSLLSVLTAGDSFTAAWMNTNGATPYYPNVIQVDGTTITPKWQGGTAPTSGNASSVDIYTFTIARVSSTSTVASAVTVFGSQTKFA